MEEIIKTITSTAPRINFKRSSIKRKVSWEIASSSAEDKKELKEIVKMISEIDKDLEKEFLNKKEGVANKK